VQRSVRAAVPPARKGRAPRGDRRNPPATRAERRHVLAVVDALTPRLVRQGARAVVLAGSWARGDAHRHSDIDLWVVGGTRRPRSRSLLRAGSFVTIAWSSEASERAKFRDPRTVGGWVPGWRHARLLYDPQRLAARIRERARAFRWRALERACDRWVAEQIAGWGEEALKLLRARSVGARATAAVQRNLLAGGLGFVLAVHRRIFWESENSFWERIGARAGAAWERAQRTALGLTGAPFDRTCEAALELYVRTAHAVGRALDPEHARLVAHVCEVIEGRRPPPRRPRGRPRRWTSFEIPPRRKNGTTGGEQGGRAGAASATATSTVRARAR
jgi:Nucleotidyltransferase domain